MGLGIILSALSAGGKAEADTIDQEQKAAIEQQRAALQEQMAEKLSSFNNDQTLENADTIRDNLQSRIAPTQDDIQGIIARNANNKLDYTDPADGSVIHAPYDRLPDEDQSNPAFQPSQKQLLEASASRALKSGDVATAADLTKIADMGKVSVGYGGKVVDQNEIDPETGEPIVVVDATAGRDAYNAGRLANGRIVADAATARAKVMAARPAGGGSRTDQQLQSYIHQGSQLTTQLRIQQSAVDNSRSADRPAAIARLNEIQEAIRMNAKAQQDRANAITNQGGPATGSGNVPAGVGSSNSVDFSTLWNQ